MLEDPMVPLPAQGRVFRGVRRVRLADAAPSGRVRLDSCARYLQDLGNDDTADSGLDDESGPWVVRRAAIDVVQSPRWGEQLGLASWCGGTGGRWAQRRLSITGEDGGSVEMDTLWIHLHPETLVPTKLPASFLEIYGGAAGGRKVSSKLWLSPPPDDADLIRRPWPLRAVDFDLMRHVNNAAYWAAVEEVLAEHDHPLVRKPLRAVLEYGPGIALGAEVELLVGVTDKQLDLWFSVDGSIQATARLIPLPE
jgi:acyl-ACP thioesterase